MKFGTFSSLLVTLAFVCSFGVDGKYTEGTEANFGSVVLGAKNPVVVMFCAEWSGLCKYSRDNLDKTVSRNPPVTMVYVDIDDSPELAKKNQVRSIPTTRGFYNGDVKNTFVGPMSAGIAQNFITYLKSKSS